MTKELKVKLVSVESGITAIGFRKIAAIAKLIEPSAEICFVATDNLYSFTSSLFPGKAVPFRDSDAVCIAKYLAQSDIIAFSSMTAGSDYVIKISKMIKETRPDAYVIWGGVHPILYPEESIAFVDCICIGEGETPVRMLLEKMMKALGRPTSQTCGSTWTERS